MSNDKCYSDLIKLNSYEDRLEYLKTRSKVGYATFGCKRILNQQFYKSDMWKKTKRDIIIRDCGNDLGIEGMEIIGGIYVHHIVPITYDDLYSKNWNKLLSPENLICASLVTHNKIHYSIESKSSVIERAPGDTKLW